MKGNIKNCMLDDLSDNVNLNNLHHWLYRRHLDLRTLNPLFHINNYKESKLDEWVKEKVSEICFEYGGYEIEADEVDNGYVWYHLGDKSEKIYEVNVSLWTNYPVSRREFDRFMKDVAEDVTKLLENRIKEPINVGFMYNQYLSLLYEEDEENGLDI